MPHSRSLPEGYLYHSIFVCQVMWVSAACAVSAEPQNTRDRLYPAAGRNSRYSRIETIAALRVSVLSSDASSTPAINRPAASEWTY